MRAPTNVGGKKNHAPAYAGGPEYPVNKTSINDIKTQGCTCKSLNINKI